MRHLTGHDAVSTRRACRMSATTRSSVSYRTRKDPLTALRQRMRELAHTRVRFGHRRLRVLLWREGDSRFQSAGQTDRQRGDRIGSAAGDATSV